MRRIILAAAVMTALLVTQATRVTLAAPITLNNPSFENTSDMDYSNGSFESSTGWNVTKHTFSYPSWSVGLYTPFLVTYPAGPPNGSKIGYIYGDTATLWQTTAKTFTAGETYTLSAFAGKRIDVGNPYGPSELRLYAGATLGSGTLLKSVAIAAPTPGTFASQTLTFGPGDVNYASLLSGSAGQSLIVALYTDGIAGGASSETDWDMVQFSFAEPAPVPEPASLMLLGLGSLFLLRRSRR